jgi:hypothetical protein
VHIHGDKLVQTVSRFPDDRSVLTQPHHVKSLVAADVLRACFNAIGAASPIITNENASDIWLLCQEVGYEKLSVRRIFHTFGPGSLRFW